MLKPKLSLRPTYIDIDGTLTDNPQQGGTPIATRVIELKKRIMAGEQIVIWSGGGTDYVRRWCSHNNITGVVMIGKPELCVDDNPNVRPPGTWPVIPPEEFFD